MATRDETVVREWQRRLRRQVLISRLTVVAVLAMFPILVISKIAHGSGGLSRGANTALGGIILVPVAWIVIALALSFRGLRCPRCNAYQGRRVGERDRISLGGAGPAGCRACHTPFV